MVSQLFVLTFLLDISHMVYSERLRNKLLVVSFDGFRADYLSKINLIHLKKLMENGISPKFVKSTFLTKTFPTHMTIVTGLNEESHGVVSNTMWDRQTGKLFTLANNSSRDVFWFQTAYPVWMSAEDNNIKSGIYFWPGSEVSYNKRRTTKYKIFDYKVKLMEIINNVTRWLIYEDIELALMYFHEPDVTSHKFGPFANETIRKVQEMDRYVGYLINILNSSRIKDNINLIILSDHGMSDQNIFVNFTFPADVKSLIEKSTDLSPFYGIFAKLCCKDLLFQKLKKIFQRFTNVKVYLKEEFPQRFHYSNNERIPDIFILGDENVVLLETDNVQSSVISSLKGNHGYNNDDENMNSFLVASGPDFKKSFGLHSESINQTDIYHLMCAVLKINPRPNNGTLKAVKMFLVDNTVNDYVNLLNAGTMKCIFPKIYGLLISITLLIGCL